VRRSTRPSTRPSLLERKEGQLGCQSSSGFQLTQFETDTAFTLYTEHCTGGRKFRSAEISALWVSKQVLILFGFPAVSKRNCWVIDVIERSPVCPARMPTPMQLRLFGGRVADWHSSRIMKLDEGEDAWNYPDGASYGDLGKKTANHSRS
jgi:hypothetical protein